MHRELILIDKIQFFRCLESMHFVVSTSQNPSSLERSVSLTHSTGLHPVGSGMELSIDMPLLNALQDGVVLLNRAGT
jgi:hypothetical protein